MKGRLYTLVFITAAAVVFTTAVAAVNEATKERVAANRRLAVRRVVLRALGLYPAAGDREVDAVYERQVAPLPGRPAEGPDAVLAGRDGQGRLVGYALPLSGRGFWDRVSGYAALAPGGARLLGLCFHEQSETPGLGAEIVKPWFEAQFRGLALPATAGPDGRFVRFLPAAEPRGPHDVQGVTGATGTTTAVERLLNEALRRARENLPQEAPP